MTDEIDAPERRCIEPTAKPPRQRGGRKPRPEPWQVEHVDAATLSKRLEYRLPPAPRPGQAVHEDDGCALADNPIPGCHPVDHELPDLHKRVSLATVRMSSSGTSTPLYELRGHRL
jgi:hypothetical protein